MRLLSANTTLKQLDFRLDHPTGINMNEENKINPGHGQLRLILRVIGPTFFIVGLVFTVVGFGSFLSAFGSMQMPRYFWCAFVGLPLMGAGGAISKFAYIGAVSRYVAGEAAPVAKDTKTIKLNSGGDSNDINAKFCDECGEQFRAAKTCDQCSTKNQPDAKYCDHCGNKFASTN